MFYPAIDVEGLEAGLLGALVDDFSPTAIEEHHDSITIYFADARARDRALEALALVAVGARVTGREVDDEDWARRSQESLKPVTIGRLIVTPPWFLDSLDVHAALSGDTRSSIQSRLPPFDSPSSQRRSGRPERSRRPTPDPRLPSELPHLPLVIAPSMGFGTGHHATTRLCLEALQTVDLTDRFVLDVGTGSGILAIAARMLGAREVVGIDYDADAIQSASENLAANPGVDRVQLIVGDLRTLELPGADVVTANLTGTLLAQTADTLLSAVRRHGLLIVSGLLAYERGDVLQALQRASRLVSERSADGWSALTLERT